LLSNSFYFFESNTCSATIAGIVGADGIGLQLPDRIKTNNWAPKLTKKGATLRILSCNIRKSDADDGPNGWSHRRELCAAVLKGRNPDIICFQEMRHEQYQDIKTAFPEHRFYGMTKTATCSHPINAIFYHAKRFTFLSAGGYWLSETPHVAGSSSWQSASIRLANWVRLKDQHIDRQFRVLNTHLDHISETAKWNQMKMILKDSCHFPDDFPQIMTGDLNVDQQHRVIQMIKDADWWDTYQKVHLPEEPGNTYHGFLGSSYQTEKGKIDWIFARGGIKVEAAHIIRDGENGRYPSDHYFVEADVQLHQSAETIQWDTYQQLEKKLSSFHETLRAP
jgi:endonuclease/exonuclease/phosphatase family metal-dependent hydrolase